MADTITESAMTFGESGPGLAACEADVSLVLQEVDAKSSQFTCKVQISNTGKHALEVVSIKPRLPDGVVLNEAVDPSVRESTARHSALCAQISALLTNIAMATSQGIADQVAKSFSQALRENMAIGAFMTAYVRMIVGGWKSYAKRVAEAQRRKFTAIEIRSADEADTQVQNLVEPLASYGYGTPEERAKYAAVESTTRLLHALIAQLREIESHQDYKAYQQAPTVQSGGLYSVLYVLRANRPWLESRAYPIYADVTLVGDGRPLGRTAGETFFASPPTAPLTLTAISFAVIGVILKIVAAERAGDGDTGLTIAQLLAALPQNADAFIVGALAATITFNLFEYTTLKEKLHGRITWRLAAFVGVLSGLLSDKVIAAFQGILSG